MKTTAAKLIASVLCGFLLSPALFATDYRYSRIDPPNSTFTVARGINAHGDILGGYTDADGVGHDFLLHNGVYTNIDYPVANAGGLAINARGDIVGNLSDANGEHGFLFSDGKITNIDYPGATSTAAFGINNSGDITGTFTTKSGAAFSYILIQGTFHRISIPATSLTTLRGAEDNGRALTGDVVESSDNSTRAFFQPRVGAVQLLSPPGTIFPCSHGRGVNERGDVAGAFGIVNSPEECGRPNHGFVFHQGTGAYDVIDPPGSTDTFIFSVNDDGAVVGATTDPNGVIHGFKAVPI